MRRALKTCLLIIACNCLVVVFMLALHLFLEARIIPSSTMEPNIHLGDRIFMEKVSRWTGKLVEHGAIVSFYPPACCLPAGQDLPADLPHVMGRLTGLPIFPYSPAYLKRIVGVPGDRIRIERGVGVYINDKLLSEPFVTAPADYSLSTLKDIGGRATTGEVIHPYGKSDEPIVVPKGMIFVLGDNRNNSEDSHVFGFVNEDRIIGRAWLMILPVWQYMHTPYWIRSRNP
jgi:signal peptidase I